MLCSNTSFEYVFEGTEPDFVSWRNRRIAVECAQPPMGRNPPSRLHIVSTSTNLAFDCSYKRNTCRTFLLPNLDFNPRAFTSMLAFRRTYWTSGMVTRELKIALWEIKRVQTSRVESTFVVIHVRNVLESRIGFELRLRFEKFRNCIHAIHSRKHLANVLLIKVTFQFVETSIVAALNRASYFRYVFDMHRISKIENFSSKNGPSLDNIFIHSLDNVSDFGYKSVIRRASFIELWFGFRFSTMFDLFLNEINTTGVQITKSEMC